MKPQRERQLWLAVVVLLPVICLALLHATNAEQATPFVPLLVMLVPGLVSARIGYRALRSADCQRERAQQSERRFAETFHASPVPLVLTNLETGAFVEVNNAFVKLIGWTHDELIGQTWSALEIINLRERQQLSRRLRRLGLIRDHATVLRRKCGEERTVTISLDLIHLEGRPHSLSTIIDHTDRMRTEAKLSALDERFQQMAGAMPDVFFLTDATAQKLFYISPAYEHVYGRSTEDLYAAPEKWIEAVHADDRPRLAASATTFDTSPIEYRVVRPDGSLRWVRSRIYPVRDANGEVIRLAGLTSDITEQRVLEDQLRQAQKIETVGSLAGGIAHDFNNVLAVISSCGGMLRETLPVGHADSELVDDILSAVGRGTGLTRQLLAFSRKQVVEPVILDLNGLVSETRKMLRRMVGEDIKLQLSLDPQVATVLADPGYLVQVIMNLVVNARDAMPRGGTVTIKTSNVGNDVHLAVTDTGTGMTPEVKARAFEAFFTTKPQGRGTGLGLSVVQGIVEQANGRIEIDSEVGRGTTFSIYLPACRTPRVSARLPIIARANGQETIVIVDDDEHVRRSTARALRANGYEVLEAADATSALRMIETCGDDVDLLFTDVVMPGMDGRELADAARKHEPDLKVLYTSGYTDDAVVRHGVMHAEVAFIEKPFQIHNLASKIRQVLDAPR